MFDEPTTVRENGRTFTEVIRPGAFRQITQPVYACVEHKRSTTFSDTTSGLLLQEDGKGLYASCYLPTTPHGDAIIRRVEAGELDGASFQFRTVKDRWQGDRCEVLQAELFDVCLTDTPAYPATEGQVHVRSDQHRKHTDQLLKIWQRKTRYH